MTTRDCRLPGIGGRRALVTGGSRGIGRAVARMLAGMGASIGLAYRADEAAAAEALTEARTAAAQAGGGAPEAVFWAEGGDLSREEDVDRLFARVDEEFGRLDLFVGNAGIWNEAEAPIGRLESAEWRGMLEANLTSIYLTTRRAVAAMGPGGRIVLLSSTAGQRGEAGHSHYAASKGAIISFCKSLATELGPAGITVNAVAPGWVDTDMSAAVLRSRERERIEREIPLRRVASADDVAGPICFLLSDLGRHITGEVLNVNGGSVLCG
ncbi:MAG: SDR family oxidoreductase [Gemmatimonadota bacterium]|nr:MAG: SDR family oxidoreductase [Gemmatimonadota bacterium]